MITELIILFLMTVLQNGSFTLVSRARNSGSYLNNAGASVLSNLIWALVMKQFVPNLGDPIYIAVYVIAAVAGSVLMQWVSIKYIEKPKVKGPSLTTEEILKLKDVLQYWDQPVRAVLNTEELTPEQLDKFKTVVKESGLGVISEIKD